MRIKAAVDQTLNHLSQLQHAPELIEDLYDPEAPNHPSWTRKAERYRVCLLQIQHQLDYLKYIRAISFKQKQDARRQTARDMQRIHQSIRRAFRGDRQTMLSLGVRPLGRPPRDQGPVCHSRHAQGDQDTVNRYQQTLDQLDCPEMMSRLAEAGLTQDMVAKAHDSLKTYQKWKNHVITDTIEIKRYTAMRDRAWRRIQKWTVRHAIKLKKYVFTRFRGHEDILLRFFTILHDKRFFSAHTSPKARRRYHREIRRRKRKQIAEQKRLQKAQRFAAIKAQISECQSTKGWTRLLAEGFG